MTSASPSASPRVPDFLRWVTIVESGVVGWAGFMMLYLPSVGFDLWAWSTPPFNSRYIGAVYWAAFLPLVLFAAIPRWSPGRVVLCMIGVFTTTIMFVMIAYADRFEPGRFHTWVYWVLYLFLPINSAVFLFRLRGLRASYMVNPQRRRYLLAGTAVALAGYGLGLLIVPKQLTSFWPWPVDAFHGRIYAATFLTPAVGALVIMKKSTPLEDIAVGAALVILGVFSVAGVLGTTVGAPASHRVDFADPGAWIFLLGNVAVAVVGILVAGRPGVVRDTAAALQAARPLWPRRTGDRPVGRLAAEGVRSTIGDRRSDLHVSGSCSAGEPAGKGCQILLSVECFDPGLPPGWWVAADQWLPPNGSPAHLPAGQSRQLLPEVLHPRRKLWCVPGRRLLSSPRP